MKIAELYWLFFRNRGCSSAIARQSNLLSSASSIGRWSSWQERSECRCIFHHFWHRKKIFDGVDQPAPRKRRLLTAKKSKRNTPVKLERQVRKSGNKVSSSRSSFKVQKALEDSEQSPGPDFRPDSGLFPPSDHHAFTGKKALNWNSLEDEAEGVIGDLQKSFESPDRASRAGRRGSLKTLWKTRRADWLKACCKRRE